MHRLTTALAAAVLALGVGTAPALARQGMGTVAPGEDSLLVTFADTPTPATAAARLAGLGPVDGVVPEAGVWRVRPTSPASARSAALGRPLVRTAEWSLARRQDDLAPPPAPPKEALPLIGPAELTDPLYVDATAQWSLHQDGWIPQLTGRRHTRIAILDGGVDSTHPEWRDNGQGSPLIFPHSTYRGGDRAEDWGTVGHGTHVAGIAAAPANGVGVVGVAPASAGGAEVIPIQIADRDGRSTDATMMAGIRWAVTHGAKVINISAGGPGYSQAFQDTVDWAYGQGALIVASVGNEGEDDNVINYPAGYDHVIGVGAQCDEELSPPDCLKPYGVARFTNHNRTTDIVAPGVGIVSSVPVRVHERQVPDQPGYAVKDGTSMAAPYVAGVAALVWDHNPDLTPYQVTRQIENTATEVGRFGRDDASGWGIVNVQAAVTEPAAPDDPAEVNDDVRFLKGKATVKENQSPVAVDAAADQFDDPHDVYPIALHRGERIRIEISYRRGLMGLSLWRPRTTTVASRVESNLLRNEVAAAVRRGRRRQVLVAVAPQSGRFFLDVQALRGGGRYHLLIDRLSR